MKEKKRMKSEILYLIVIKMNWRVWAHFKNFEHVDIHDWGAQIDRTRSPAFEKRLGERWRIAIERKGEVRVREQMGIQERTKTTTVMVVKEVFVATEITRETVNEKQTINSIKLTSSSRSLILCVSS
ncbi:hypothetical protein WN55_11023 [Dufourea novaeangliae]|uniref:Uncharacterized protein n=1 Tax=Dufourea novaeangliae TaxID=178035 RepID=A0A154PBR9_DUFNO|nr:hypothetical protein WN55_11023 [Dufourea novaeangliae]